jgi:antitoxin component YwqK of YwqJK toxin-antitoxin module
LLLDELKLYSHLITEKKKFIVQLKSNGFIKGSFLNGKLNGKLEKTNADGKVLVFFTFANGELNGNFQLNDASGKIRQIGKMLAGAPEGEIISYTEQGKLLSKKNYSGGFLDGQQTLYYSNQNIKCSYFFSNAMLNGNFESFYSDGSIHEKGSISNGLLNGVWQYKIEIPEYIQKVILRNPKFFNENYEFNKEWTAQKLQNKYLEFKANYTLFKSNECLNNLCSNLEIVETK